MSVCVCDVCVVSWGSYFEHALAWDQRMGDPELKVITYEELKQVAVHLKLLLSSSEDV